MVTTSSFPCRIPSCALLINQFHNRSSEFKCSRFCGILNLRESTNSLKLSCSRPVSVLINTEKVGNVKIEEEEKRPRFRWVEVGPGATEIQKQAIAQLPSKMEKRCKAVLKQIICFDPQIARLPLLLSAWVTIMKPRRADWLAVLKELKKLDHPLLFEVTELALLEDSFEAHVRDYTKLIDEYGKQNRIQDAENTLSTMKTRGFKCDQVILTAMLNIYSKANNLKQAQETFEEMKLLDEPLDKRSYGSMIMAYLRAKLANKSEDLLKEMEALDIYPGSEVYKALLRAYAMVGNYEKAQNIFNAIQFAGIVPDARLCGLLITAYGIGGQSQKARLCFENMRRAGLEPSDNCVAFVLSAYEKENNLDRALGFLMDLERDGVVIGKEASEMLAGWFRRLGVVDEVKLALQEYAEKEANN